MEEYTTSDGLLDNTIIDITTSANGDLFIANRRQILKYNNGEFEEVINLQEYPRVQSIFVDKNNILWLVLVHHNTHTIGAKFMLFDCADNYKSIDQNAYVSNLSEIANKTMFRLFFDIDQTPYFITKEDDLFEIGIDKTASFNVRSDSIEVLHNSYILPTFHTKRSYVPFSIYRPELEEHIKSNPLFEVADGTQPWINEGSNAIVKYRFTTRGVLSMLGYKGWQSYARSGVNVDLFFNNEKILLLERDELRFSLLSDQFPQYFTQRKILDVEDFRLLI